MDARTDRTSVEDTDEAGFQGVVLGATQAVLVMFWAPWSRPCQLNRTVLDDLSRDGMAGLRIVRINADDNPGLGMAYEIQSIPTLLFFVNGALRDRVVGTVSREAILTRLQSVLRGDPAPSPAPGSTHAEGAQDT